MPESAHHMCPQQSPGMSEESPSAHRSLKSGKFKKVVVLDTVIFYPEHEDLLKSMVEKPVIERVPLTFDDSRQEWCLPPGYELPENATIVIWPSSLPETLHNISLETHERLGTAQCWAPALLRENLSAQNLLSRIADADCILTCWTNIPDEVLDAVDARAIITWTHEFEHRLNVAKASALGIYTNCVPDYGTEAVAELQWDGLLRLIERNKATGDKASTSTDLLVGVLRHLFDRYRKAHVNERNTRRGKFSHQFHKLGRSQAHYGSMRERDLDDIIPYRLIEGKTIGILGADLRFDTLLKVLSQGFRMITGRYSSTDHDDAAFYRFLTAHETIVYDSAVCSVSALEKIRAIHPRTSLDVQTFCHYQEDLAGKNGRDRRARPDWLRFRPNGQALWRQGPVYRSQQEAGRL